MNRFKVSISLSTRYSVNLDFSLLNRNLSTIYLHITESCREVAVSDVVCRRVVIYVILIV